MPDDNVNRFGSHSRKPQLKLRTCLKIRRLRDILIIHSHLATNKIRYHNAVKPRQLSPGCEMARATFFFFSQTTRSSRPRDRPNCCSNDKLLAGWLGGLEQKTSKPSRSSPCLKIVTDVPPISETLISSQRPISSEVGVVWKSKRY